jgi:hypothetical protein
MKHKHVSRLVNKIEVLALLCLMVAPLLAQHNLQDEYLKSTQQKSSFNDNRYNGLKQKMMQESGGKPNNSNFNPDNFEKPGNSQQESNYGFEPEEYKGEYDSYYPKEQGTLDSEPLKSKPQSDKENEDYFDSDGYSPHSNKKEDTYKDYYKEKSSETFKPLKNKLKPLSKKSQKTVPPTSGEVQLMQLLLIILGAALIAFLIYYFFLRYNANEKGAKIELEEEKNPMEIPKSELERRLEGAISQENFREAVRIYFIFIIKELAEKEWIKWEKEKTNITYLIEMRQRPQYGLFNQTVIIFEWVWYGQYEVTEQDFKGWEPLFKQLLNELK